MIFCKPLPGALLSVALVFFPLAAQAMLIDKQLVLRPIQICNTLGDCANDQREVFEDMGDTIWSQAGIDLMFEEFTSVVDQRSFDISFSELTGFTSINDPNPGPNWFVDAPGKVSGTNVVNLWFTNSIEGFGAAPLGVTDGDPDSTGMFLDVVRNNILISDRIFTDFFTGPAVIAHEIGHVLGLNHCGFEILFLLPYVPCEGATIDTPDNLNLMQPTGGVGAVSVLTAAQVETARQSPFLIDFEPAPVPVPAPWALLLVGILILSGRGRFSPQPS